MWPSCSSQRKFLEDKRDLHNIPVFNKLEQLPSALLHKDGERTGQSLQDMALRQT